MSDNNVELNFDPFPSDSAELNVNPFMPDVSAGHPVLDELVTVGLLKDTTIRQMRDKAYEVLENYDTLREAGLARGIVFLVDRIEEMSA